MTRAPSPRLRIAFVYDALVPYCSGGAERRFHELATRLADRHDVHQVTWRFWGGEPTIVRDGVTLHGVGAPRGFYGADGKRTIREASEFAARLPAVLARIGADIVDASATPFLPLYAAWATTRVTRTPLVATWHEFWGDHWLDYLPDRPAVARAARFVEATARSLGDRRVAVSAFTARRMVGTDRGHGWSAEGPGARGGSGSRQPDRPRDRIDVVANGVDLETMEAAVPDPERSDVIYVGRLIDEKRVDLMIRAVAGLVGRLPSIRCAIVGDGPERAALAALATDLGVAPNVRFHGRVPDDRVPSLMRASRILVLPSAREGYGITVVEGQACGLVPVVAASPMSAAPDLVLDGVDGLVVDPSVEGLATALGGLLEDADRLERIARAARASARDRGWAARALEMERVYLEVVEARAGRTAPGERVPRPLPETGATLEMSGTRAAVSAPDGSALVGDPRW